MVLFLSFVSIAAADADIGDPYGIELDFVRDNADRCSLSSCVQNNTGKSGLVYYVIKVEKGDKTVIRQEGNIFIQRDEKKCDFAKAAVTITAGPVLSASLRLYKKGELLIKAAASCRPSQPVR